jgi:hypothetical protein
MLNSNIFTQVFSAGSFATTRFLLLMTIAKTAFFSFIGIQVPKPAGLRKGGTAPEMRAWFRIDFSVLYY